MPKIQQAQAAGGVSMDVQRAPTRSIESAGIVEKATAGLTKQIAGHAVDFANQLAQSEARSLALKNKTEHSLQADSLLEDMKKEDKYATSMEGFTEDYQKRLGDAQNKLLSDTPNPLSKRTSEGALADINLSSAKRAQAYERNERVARTYENINNSVDNIANSQALAFSPDKYIQGLTDITAEFTGNDQMFTPDQKRKGIEQAREVMFDSFSTYYENNPELVQDGINILEGGYGKKSEAMLHGLDSKKVGATLERFKKLQKQNGSINRSNINRKISDITSAIKSGKFLNDQDFDQVAGLALASDFENKAEMVDTVQGLKIMNDEMKTFMGLSAKEKQAALNDKLKLTKADGAFNATSRAALDGLFPQVKKNLLDQMELKGADFATTMRSDVANLSNQILNPLDSTVSDEQFRETVQTYIASTRATQQDAGISNVKFLTEDMANNYGTIVTSQDGKVAAIGIERLQNSFGDASGNILKELIDSKKVSQEHAPAFYVTDMTSRETILENIKNKDEIIAGYKQTTPNNIDNEKDVLASSELRDFRIGIDRTHALGANSKIANGFNDAILLDYKRRRKMGIDHDDAKKQSIKAIMTDNFDTTNNTVGLIIPKDIGVDKDEVENFAEEAISGISRFAEEFDISVPKSYEGSKENYLDHLEDTAQWKWDGGNGAVLQEMTSTGPAKITDSKGREIRFNYKDMNEKAFTRRKTDGIALIHTLGTF